nr:MAG TPA: hypothetical protein [Caudoviricetes sp.]
MLFSCLKRTAGKTKRPPYTGGLFANTINKERRDCDSKWRYAE